MIRIMCDMQGEFYVEERTADGLNWEPISPSLGKGKEGFYAAKEWLENHLKGDSDD